MSSDSVGRPRIKSRYQVSEAEHGGGYNWPIGCSAATNGVTCGLSSWRTLAPVIAFLFSPDAPIS